MRSVSSDSSDMGVASITSSTEGHDDDNTPARNPRPTRQNSGWRRHMSEASSNDGETHEERGHGRGRGGAFV